VSVEYFFYSDEDDRFDQQDGVAVFIHVVFLFRFGHVAHSNEEISGGEELRTLTENWQNERHTQ